MKQEELKRRAHAHLVSEGIAPTEAALNVMLRFASEIADMQYKVCNNNLGIQVIDENGGYIKSSYDNPEAQISVSPILTDRCYLVA